MIPHSILIVDDDKDFVQIAERAVRLEHLDVEVQVARDGKEALARLGIGEEESVERSTPAAVFLDLNLPGIEGLEVLRRVRADERLSCLPVVIVSSSARGRDISRSYALGANSYVVKRFDSTGPGRYIARAMRYWLELNRPPTLDSGAR